MSKIIKPMLIASTLLAATTITTPASATPQEDMAKCRQQMNSAGILNMSDYRLKFEGIRGNTQGRTLRLQAVPRNNSIGSRFKFSCRLEKYTVVALKNNSKETLYALND